jgi:hypothetical protein
MVVNFRARGISRGARKLARTPTIIKKKKKERHKIVNQTMKFCKNSSVLLFFRDIEENQSKMKITPSPCKIHKNHTRNRARRWQVGCAFNHWLPANQSKKRLIKSCKEAQSYAKMHHQMTTGSQLSPTKPSLPRHFNNETE